MRARKRRRMGGVVGVGVGVNARVEVGVGVETNGGVGVLACASVGASLVGAREEYETTSVWEKQQECATE